MDYEHFMQTALRQAQQALDHNEFPVGCAIVDQHRVVATGRRHGTTSGSINEVDHAEMIALRALAAQSTAFTPRNLTAFCTMEPCLMCFGALILSGVRRIVYAYEDVMGGATRCDLGSLTPLYQKSPPTVIPDILRPQSLALFKAYFEDPRNQYWRSSLLARYTLEQQIE
jgi:tRNA(adenine34) deaminase